MKSRHLRGRRPRWRSQLRAEFAEQQQGQGVDSLGTIQPYGMFPAPLVNEQAFAAATITLAE